MPALMNMAEGVVSMKCDRNSWLCVIFTEGEHTAQADHTVILHLSMRCCKLFYRTCAALWEDRGEVASYLAYSCAAAAGREGEGSLAACPATFSLQGY